ncbi:hypothetical protein ACO1YS_23325 [Klebsiella quasipneumoniae]|uniref:hypothetical protein n=1 Tax=Klebsiella quasipneumoniae TaxID=1463165 RepID=UPI003B86C252
MKLNNYLSKFFDVEENEEENDEGEKIPSLWLYEKGEDSEPVVICVIASDLTTHLHFTW